MKRRGWIMAGAMALLFTSGCGMNTGEETVALNVENIPVATQEEGDSSGGEQSTVNEGAMNESDISEGGADPTAIQETAELLGNVVSVGDNSVVVSKNFTEELEDGKGDIMWAPAEGSEDEVLINVIFTKDTRYEYKTVKNSGINPEDIQTREGTFEDIKKDLNLDMTGSYQGDDFYAVRVTISEFIH